MAPSEAWDCSRQTSLPCAEFRRETLATAATRRLFSRWDSHLGSAKAADHPSPKRTFWKVGIVPATCRHSSAQSWMDMGLYNPMYNAFRMVLEAHYGRKPCSAAGQLWTSNCKARINGTQTNLPPLPNLKIGTTDSAHSGTERTSCIF